MTRPAAQDPVTAPCQRPPGGCLSRYPLSGLLGCPLRTLTCSPTVCPDVSPPRPISLPAGRVEAPGGGGLAVSPSLGLRTKPGG